MIAGMARQISSWLVRQGALSEDDWEVCAYGWECRLGDIAGMLLLACCALPLGLAVHALVFYLAFARLRVWAGGFHLNSHASCLIASVGLALVTVWLLRLLPPPSYRIISAFACLVMLPLVYLRAPVAHPNNPKTEQEEDECRFKSRRVAWVETVLFLAALALPGSFQVYVVCGASGALLASLTLLIPNDAAGGGDYDDEQLT